jgi:hypothetical protein
LLRLMQQLMKHQQLHRYEHSQIEVLDNKVNML